jgi:hypothetical protein
MKIKIFLILIICLGLNESLSANKISDFESDLSSIASSFVENIMDDYKCNGFSMDAEDLGEEIKKFLNDESDDLTANEQRVLNSLQKKAESLEVYINMCCGSSVAYPTVEEFQIANELVQANVAYLSKDKYCVDFIQISINKFICVAVINSNTTGYNVKFSWKSQNSGISGKVDMGVAKKSIRPFCNNHSEKIKDNLVFQNVTCKAFEYNL